MSSSSRGRLEGRLTQVGQAGRCTTADRSLPGSWDAERQVHRQEVHMQEGQIHRCTHERGARGTGTQVHMQEGSFSAQKCGRPWLHLTCLGHRPRLMGSRHT